MSDERDERTEKRHEQSAGSKTPTSNWVSRSKGIEVGDKVCYSRKFLQSTGQYTGDSPHARGIVKAITPLGQTTLAEIDWDKPDLPQRVNVANLSKVTEKGILESP